MIAKKKAVPAFAERLCERFAFASESCDCPLGLCDDCVNVCIVIKRNCLNDIGECATCFLTVLEYRVVSKYAVRICCADILCLSCDAALCN